MGLDEVTGFLGDHAELFGGARVLDFGSGREPHRALVEEAGGEYHAFDRRSFAGSACAVDVGPEDWRAGWWDVILCTEVVQCVSVLEIVRFLGRFAGTLARSRGHLVLTYPSCAPAAPGELWRFTEEGMEWLLGYARLTTVEHVAWDGGGGVVAR